MTTKITVPMKGDDAELDTMVTEAVRIMTTAGVATDEAVIRETLYKRLLEARGEAAIEEPEDETPKVDLKASAKKFDAKKVVEALVTEEAYWYDDPKDKKFIDLFFELRTKANAVANLLLTGPSGSGKTEGLMRAAAAYGRPFYKMDCATITTEDRWIGRKEIDHTGTRFVMSEHLKWLEGVEHEPGVICYDEVNRVHAHRLNILLPILDGSQGIFVPDLGRVVKVHPDTIIVATANIGSAFGGTHVMDRAFRERFTYTIERNFPPHDHEVKVIVTSTGCPEDKAAAMVTIAEQTRKKWETDDLESPISTRTLKAAGLLVAAGMSVVDALEYTALPLYKSDGGADSERTMVRQIITGKTKS